MISETTRKAVLAISIATRLLSFSTNFAGLLLTRKGFLYGAIFGLVLFALDLPALQKSLELFNTHRAKEHSGLPFIIVERAISATMIHQAGFPRVAALLGASFSKLQEVKVLEMGGDYDRIP
jgi:hypothetical protein